MLQCSFIVVIGVVFIFIYIKQQMDVRYAPPTQD